MFFYQLPLLPEFYIALGDYMLLKGAFTSPKFGYKKVCASLAAVSSLRLHMCAVWCRARCLRTI